MKITDYEAGRTLSDVAITLTREEAEDLAAYLHRLIHVRDLRHVHVNEIHRNRIEKELTIAINDVEAGTSHP